MTAKQIGSLLGEIKSESKPSTKKDSNTEIASGREYQPQSTGTIDRFYTALKAIYGSKFTAQFDTAAEVRQSKAMWAENIAAQSDDKLRECLRNAKRQMMGGNPDYQWPNIGLILGHGSDAWERQCHKPFRPDRALEDKTGWEKRRAANIDALAKLREETGI